MSPFCLKNSLKKLESQLNNGTASDTWLLGYQGKLILGGFSLVLTPRYIFQGYAEPIRTLLHYLNVPFKDVRYGFGSGDKFPTDEEWTKEKVLYCFRFLVSQF